MTTAQIFGLSLALAFLCESSVEYFLGQIVKHLPKLQHLSWLLMYVSLAAGIGLCFYYRMDLITVITNQGGTQLGYILSGLIVGRGGNYVHDFWSMYLAPKFK